MKANESFNQEMKANESFNQEIIANESKTIMSLIYNKDKNRFCYNENMCLACDISYLFFLLTKPSAVFACALFCLC